jgi:hypothetical protein
MLCTGKVGLGAGGERHTTVDDKDYLSWDRKFEQRPAPARVRGAVTFLASASLSGVAGAMCGKPFSARGATPLWCPVMLDTVACQGAGTTCRVVNKIFGRPQAPPHAWRVSARRRRSPTRLLPELPKHTARACVCIRSGTVSSVPCRPLGPWWQSRLA